jgi:ankyrin repeat protein
MGGTALHWGHFSGSRAVISRLEHAGADRDARDYTLRCTPRAFGICVPANWGFIERLRERLANDPALATFMDGRTSALHEAARGGSSDAVRLLLDAGADPAVLDGDGRTALEIASEHGHADAVELLRSAQHERQT